MFPEEFNRIQTNNKDCEYAMSGFKNIHCTICKCQLELKNGGPTSFIATTSEEGKIYLCTDCESKTLGSNCDKTFKCSDKRSKNGLYYCGDCILENLRAFRIMTKWDKLE